jgi:hypothetical protein
MCGLMFMRWKQTKSPLHSASIPVILDSRLVKRVKTGLFHLITTSAEAPGWLSLDSIEGDLGKNLFSQNVLSLCTESICQRQKTPLANSDFITCSCRQSASCNTEGCLVPDIPWKEGRLVRLYPDSRTLKVKSTCAFAMCSISCLMHTVMRTSHSTNSS